MYIIFPPSLNYTIPKIKRELKHKFLMKKIRYNYTIPKIKRELKPIAELHGVTLNYTIPKIKRELKPRRSPTLCS